MIFFLIRLLKLRVQTQLLQKISGCYAWISSFWYLYLQVLVRCWLWKSPVVSVSRPGVQSLKYTWSYLGSGFKFFYVHPYPREMIQIDDDIFQKRWNHQLVTGCTVDYSLAALILSITSGQHVNFHCHWRNHPWFLQCLLFNIRCAELTAPGAAQYQACSYIV